MDDGSRSSLLIVIALLLCAAYFAVAETAFASVSRVKIKVRADRGEQKAIRAMWVLEHFDRAITSILICTNIVHIAAASIVTVTVTRLWGVGYVSLSTIIMTVVVFFAGEMLPKSIAKKYSERLSLAVAVSLCFFMAILKPFSLALSAVGNFAARFVTGGEKASVTEDEIYDIIEDMTEEGTLDSEQGELISSALQFGDTTVESILTARVDMVALDIKTPPEELLAFIKEQRHSRIPVYEGTIDNIIGVLSIRKYCKARLHEAQPDLRSLLDEVHFVHQSTLIDELLPAMSQKRLNMAVVTDNYGGTVGIVTVEDILEELVGEIWDEDDEIRESAVDLGGGIWDCDAGMAMPDVFALLDLEPEDEDAFNNKLLGEWAYEQFAAIPQVGDSFVLEGVEVTVAVMEHNRILRLTVSRREQEGN